MSHLGPATVKGSVWTKLSDWRTMEVRRDDTMKRTISADDVASPHSVGSILGPIIVSIAGIETKSRVGAFTGLYEASSFYGAGTCNEYVLLPMPLKLFFRDPFGNVPRSRLALALLCNYSKRHRRILNCIVGSGETRSRPG